MIRLTKKYSNGFLPKYERETKENYYDLVYRLGQLEDIEEELGIDLITLFKALKDGIYVKTRNGINNHSTIHLTKWQQTNTYCLYYRPYSHIWFKDYGKTWALTRQELENGEE